MQAIITRQFSLEQMPDYPFDKEYDIKRIAFFDIETTGLAADSSYLYLIGCAYYQASSFRLIQWFSEDIHEEELLLTAFFKFIKDYDVLLHYNGSGFDIPYLQRKCSMLSLDYSFDQLISIDIYKKIQPYKKLLKLSSLRLKSIEAFLNIRRRDTFDGGDLIQVYQSYLGKKHYETLKRSRDPEFSLPIPSEAELLLNQLLLHNEDDIRGLLRISPILNYADLFEKPIRILHACVEQNNLDISFAISAALPVPVNIGNDLAHLTAVKDTARLSVPVYDGELKYYYENYKDYYYLPEEDRAVHKSVAQFVDKEYRVKAKPSNCYTRKQGIFVPQYTPVISPYFKLKDKDKLTFLEVHTDFLLQEDNLERYVRHMLENIM